MDFIGQKGPTSKVHLVFLDFLVVGLQVVQLSATMVRRKLKDSSPAEVASTAIDRSRTGTAQDLDSEERGIRRSQEQESIELQDLGNQSTQQNTHSSTSAVGPTSSTERDALLATPEPRFEANILDTFNSGQIIIADLDLGKTLEEQVRLHKNPPPESERANQQTLRAELAGRMLRMRFARGIQ